ncbi:MAG: PP2C family protein-serine/threonine phosphatase [Bacteroidota bacterium]|nr:PP2C family protein-serine/threonine phosphatase [Bacteroidota bacterium]
MEELTDRINRALAKEEARAERFANSVRFILLSILTAIALLNSSTVSVEANILNTCALLIGYAYGLIIIFTLYRTKYVPLMKYATSCFDIILVFLLLFLYTRIEIPSVALKNYVFLILFPLIGLTVFRYDRTLTLISGGLAVLLYLGLIFYLNITRSITFTNEGYVRELFSEDVTVIGQLTKILILCGYVVLMAYLAQYSRKLFVKIVSNESNLRIQKELIEWELKIASDVQMQLQPRRFPEFPKLEIYGVVEQGKYVGGDYCDFIKIADDVLLIVLADVSGKGVPAALIMSEVRASVHLLASKDLDIESLVQQINTLLYKSTRKKDFVTFFTAIINTSKHLLSYANCGHPPPFIYSNGNFRSLDQRSLPLGLFNGLSELSVQSEEFSQGSVFVAYTDGLLERMNLDKEQFGEERLRNIIRENVHLDVQPFTQHVIEELKQFGQGKDLEDDVSLAIVKYSDKIQS